MNKEIKHGLCNSQSKNFKIEAPGKSHERQNHNPTGEQIEIKKNDNNSGRIRKQQQTQQQLLTVEAKNVRHVY